MKIIMKLAALAIAFAIPAVAQATDLRSSMVDKPVAVTEPSWTGIYVGAFGGYGNGNHKIEGACADCASLGEGESQVSFPVSGFMDGLNSHDPFGGLIVGADIQRGHFLVGVFADYAFSKSSFDVGISVNNASVAKASIEDGNRWTVGGRVGYLLDSNTLAYVLGGYTHTDITYSYTVGANSDSLKNGVNGYTLGGGVEYALTNYLRVGAEYRHTFFDKDTLASGEGWSITDRLDDDRVMLTLKAALTPKAFGF